MGWFQPEADVGLAICLLWLRHIMNKKCTAAVGVFHPDQRTPLYGLTQFLWHTQSHGLRQRPALDFDSMMTSSPRTFTQHLCH